MVKEAVKWIKIFSNCNDKKPKVDLTVRQLLELWKDHSIFVCDDSNSQIIMFFVKNCKSNQTYFEYVMNRLN